MIIYWRTCELQKSISYLNRWKNYNKTDILKRCWLSIQESISNEDTLVLLQDNLTEETLEWLKSTCKTTLIKVVNIPKHAWNYHQHTVTLIEELEKTVLENKNEIHFILEDDYLFVPEGISIFKNLAKQWNNGFLAPYDYIDRYKELKNTQIILGPDRHWRTVSSITMTVAAKGFVWSNFFDVLKESAPTSNDKVFEHILEKVPCLTPLPTLASHLTEYHTSPYMNVDALWKYYGEKI